MNRIYIHTREYLHTRHPAMMARCAPYWLYLRYLVAGGIAATTDIALLYVFTDLFGIWYLISATLAFLVAVVVSFVLQKFWTFRDKGTDGMHRQAASYLGVQLTGIAANTIGMYLLVGVAGLWYILAQIIMGALIAIFNFVMYRNFIFAHP